MKKRKILVLLTPVFNIDDKENWLPWQTVFVRAVNALCPDLQLVILSFHFPEAKQSQLTWEGNEVYLFGNGKKSKAAAAFRWLRIWRVLEGLHRQNEIAGMLSFFCSESAWIGYRFAKRKKLRHKIWVLGQDARKENKMVRRIGPAADDLVAVSDFLQRSFFQHHGIAPAHVIPLGVMPAMDENEKPRNIDLLGAGSLIALKQYDLFIEVVKKVQAVFPGTQAVICGDGEARASLEAQAAAAGLTAHLSMPGYLQHQEVLQLMRQAKIFLHTSAYEGLGVVNLEALYAGAHVISFVQPLDASVKNWHIAANPQEMADIAIALLSDTVREYAPVLVQDMRDTVRSMLSLLGVNTIR